MIGILLAVTMIIWAFFRNRVAFIALCLLFIGFLWRLFAATYLDLAGPLYSHEVGLIVGGDSFAANMFGAYIALTVGVMLFIFRPAYLNRELAKLKLRSYIATDFSLGDLVFCIVVIFISGLFLDLYRIGIIPLFDCMERYEYLKHYAGYFHKFLFKYGSLLAIQLGVFTVYPKLLGGRYDWRFVALVVMLYIYLALTGNRFSGFYSLTLFFITPFSLIVLSKTIFSQNFIYKSKDQLINKTILASLIVSGLAIVVLSLINSYGNVRYDDVTACPNSTSFSKSEAVSNEAVSNEAVSNEAVSNEAVSNGVVKHLSLWWVRSYTGLASRISTYDVRERFSQRVLVQPSHLFFLTTDRVIKQKDWQPEEARSYIFNLENSSKGNRSIRFLMNRTLTSERALYLESVGHQFAGGYPEVLLELVGPWGAFPLVLMLAAITSWLLRFWALSVLRGYFLTAFFAAYVYYAFVVMYVGGMLNFLVVWTFWTKVILLFIFSWLEPYCDRKGWPLTPWSISQYFRLIKRS